MQKQLRAAVFLSIVLGLWGGLAMDQGRILLISAHRGASGLAPENTLATFQEALQQGADYLEIDVRTTRDSQLVILHDGTLDRTTMANGKVSDRTWGEIKSVSAGKGWNHFTQPIPTLEEVCQLVAHWNTAHRSKAKLYVDCKAVEPRALVTILSKYHLQKDAVYYGSDAFLSRLKQEDSALQVMPGFPKNGNWQEKAERLQPYAFDIPAEVITPELIATLHQHHIRTFVDLLDQKDTIAWYRKAVACGVDCIQTDHVTELRQALTQMP
ncbi:glycerophosphodiester phosphodiesterase family protein [Siphonobacter sp. SORGH_AS_0500]|uniref:glycerophosphodiester phosphodiesterase n=1 Tax=Siphonobacter sp. SORGH_AS_0500 TaxID=1864824 RepID=UPI0028603BC9|nr:glycerophosphodiester phosphodiesterase family protein [Siphonobacter sp. SORGH_AS_0500]MDR6197671.1 glycerophosphoryl diester phosphodiesterase [Siphonobacter sp. SORGH_AS_0500]